MDNMQDDIEVDIENNRTVFLKESDPFLPIILSPGIQEEPLEERLKTPPATPIHSPHVFLKEDRWLFSPPPVLTSEHTNLDNFGTGFNLTRHDTDKEKKPTALRKRAARPTSLVLFSEENPPRKRAKPTITTTPSTTTYRVHQNPPLLLGLNTLGFPIFTSQTSPFVCWDRTSYLESTTLAADCVPPNTQFGEKTHYLMYTKCELSGLPDI